MEMVDWWCYHDCCGITRILCQHHDYCSVVTAQATKYCLQSAVDHSLCGRHDLHSLQLFIMCSRSWN
jgi:hypothetical protein